MMIMYLKNKSLTFIDNLQETLFRFIVFLLKPIVQFIYRIYRKYQKCSTKQRRLTNRICLSVVLILLLSTVFAFGSTLLTAKVNAQNDEILHKYYTSIVVEPGTSLWDIANENYELGYDSQNDYIEEVININHIKDENQIESGTTLVIPYYSPEIK